MYLLPALAAGLVRCIYIDRLDKLSEGIGGQLRDGAVPPLYPLNKLLLYSLPVVPVHEFAVADS